MDVRGQRILIFGDSLSHHGHDNAPEIWDVDQGSARVSGQPGDLLASMLLEQGASAVRVNARVGRSAHNFFGREDFHKLFTSDQVFLPTKVFVVLGTNDIGLNMQADANAMEKIRDFYKGLGAEVWAIGPFAYTSDQLNQQAEPVVTMMRGVFGKRYIDPRPVTALVGRARDGVHFGADAARVTAQGLQQLVLATAQPKTWLPFAIGLVGAVGGALAYSWWKKGGAGVAGLGQAAFCDPNLSPAAFKRCNQRQRQQRALGGDDEEDPLAKRQRVSNEIRELIRDSDPAAMAVAEDLALQHEIKLSELSKGGTDDRGTFWIESASKDVMEQARVSWRIKRVNERHGGECKAIFDVRIDGKRVGGEERESDHVKFEEHYQGSRDFCRRAATSQAWAIAKETKKLRAKGFTPQAHDIFHVLDRDNSQPEELFGLRGEREDRNEHPTETFKMLVRAANTPAELVAAKDYALEHGIKIGEQRALYLSPIGAPDDPATGISWKITRVKGRGPDGEQQWEVEWDALLDGTPLHIGAGFPRRAKSLREIEQVVGAEAWEIANELKLLRGKPFTEKHYRMRVVDALYSDAARDHLKEQPDLFGLGARKIPTSRYDSNEAAIEAGRINKDVTYVELDEDLKDKRRAFRRLLDDEGPEVLDVAEDFAEHNDIPISVLTTLNHDNADSGTVKIYPAKGHYDSYNVWWDVFENPNRPGEWEPELLLAWGTHREPIGSVPHIRNGEWTKPLIPFGTAESAEEARRIAAMNAWEVSKLLRTLPRSASIEDAQKLLREREAAHADDPRFRAVNSTSVKRDLFGQSSALRSGMAGYRIGYSGVGPDGRTVIRFVTDEVAPDLATAERWRRRFKNSNGWIEDEDGNHVPVKGALKPAKRNWFSAHATSDQLPKWLR